MRFYFPQFIRYRRFDDGFLFRPRTCNLLWPPSSSFPFPSCDSHPIGLQTCPSFRFRARGYFGYRCARPPSKSHGPHHATGYWLGHLDPPPLFRRRLSSLSNAPGWRTGFPSPRLNPPSLPAPRFGSLDVEDYLATLLMGRVGLKVHVTFNV
jgi:hypothetical protein